MKDEIKTYIKTLKNAKDFPELENLDVDNSTLEELVGQLQNISVVNNQNLELNIKRFSESLGELQRNLSDIETASNNYIPPEIWNDGMVH
ncbi:MAG: hypothetical protein LBU14_03230 [Candidatus Peribacteria bacterium]|nr:hypothetical protein [Candidatus Peribacteria bacterium]